MGTSTARKALPQQKRQKAPKWPHRKWGTLDDPIHKSDFSKLIGKFSCLRQFQLRKTADVAGASRDRASLALVSGTASHGVIERILEVPAVFEPLLAGAGVANRQQVLTALHDEYQRASRGIEVIDYKGVGVSVKLNEKADMVVGLFQSMGKHVRRPILSEAGFICRLGSHWLEGHIDLIYEPVAHPGGIGTTDWKSGKQRPHQRELDQGYEGGIYSTAIRHGAFVPNQIVRAIRDANGAPHGGFGEIESLAISGAPSDRDAMHVALRLVGRKVEQGMPLPECVVRFERFPDEIRYVHMQDFVPYTRKQSKAVSRPEELEHFGLSEPGKVTCEKGDPRGPGWYCVRRSENDIPRLEHLVRATAGWVRFGKFVPSVDEKCDRCEHRSECLTDGYEIRGEEAKALNQSLRGLDIEAGLDGLDGI